METTTIPIVELEQFKLLPVPTQKLIEDIGGELKSNSLILFNPLVESMTKIEAFRSIKYDADDAETVKSFKTAKSTIRSFRAATTKAKKTLKAPYIALGKNIDKIEKTFKDSATEVLELLEVEFEDYLNELEAKKVAREEKKNKEVKEKMDEMSAETIQQNLIIQRMNAFSGYSKSVFGMSKTISDKVANYSKSSLQGELDILAQQKLLITNEDKAVLLEEQVVELQENFDIAIDNAKTMINMKIAEFNLPVSDNGVEAMQPLAETADIEVEFSNEINVEDLMETFVAPGLVFGDKDYFKTSLADIITETIEKIDELETSNESEVGVQKKVIQSFSAIQDKVNDYLK